MSCHSIFIVELGSVGGVGGRGKLSQPRQHKLEWHNSWQQAEHAKLPALALKKGALHSPGYLAEIKMFLSVEGGTL